VKRLDIHLGGGSLLRLDASEGGSGDRYLRVSMRGWIQAGAPVEFGGTVSSADMDRLISFLEDAI
jgi:hypothetical protein